MTIGGTRAGTALAFLILLSATPAGAQSARGDRWLGPDKVKHFLASFLVQSVAYATLRTGDASHGASLAGASLATAAVGILKERSDRRRAGLFSGRDLAWDAAGGLAAALLLRRTER